MSWLIYKHTSPSGKVYIGQTSKQAHNRWGNKGHGYEPTFKFGQAIIKYGWDNIKHEIIETGIPTQELADEREKYWISFFDSYQNGYNMTPGGRGGVFNGSTCIGVYQIDINKNILQHFKSITEASEILKILPQNIGQCLRGQQLTCNGFYFLPDTIDVNNFELPTSKYNREIICIELNAIFDNLKEASQKTGVAYGLITKNCARMSITAGNLHFAYLDEYDEFWRPVEPKEREITNNREIICVETGQTWNSIIDCSIETGILPQNLSQNCCLNHRSAKGKHFAYIEEFDDLWKPAAEYNTKRRKESSTLTKRVYCLQTNKFYESATICADELNLTPREVSRCAKKDGDLIQTHGYNFCYEEDWFDGWKPRKSVKGKHTLSNEQKCVFFNKNGIKVKCVETNTIYNSAKEAMRITGIHSDLICRVCKKVKGYNTAGGYHWEYVGGSIEK